MRGKNKDGTPRLTTLEKKFVKEVARTGSPSKALSILQPEKANSVVRTQAANMLARPVVQNALDKELEKMHPTLNADVASVIVDLTNHVRNGEASFKEKMEYVKLIAELRGLKTPNEKAQPKKVTNNIKQLTMLPWEKE